MTITAPKRRLRFYDKPLLSAQELEQTYRVYTHDEKTSGFERGGAHGYIRLDSGRLFVDDLPILEPRISEDGISWHQQIDGRYSGGHLTFVRGRTELHGIVNRGTTAADAVLEHVLATTVPVATWETKISAKRHPQGTDPSTLPASEWQDGLSVQVGFEQHPGDPTPVAKVSLGGEDVSDMTTWTIDPKTQQTVLLFRLESVSCQFNPALYLNAHLSFDQMKPEPTCSGVVETTCAEPGENGESFLWTGTLAPGTEPTAAAAPETISLTSDDLQSDPSLSIAELIGLVPDKAVSETANSMILENLKWAMGQNSEETGWLRNYIGENPPALEPARQELVEKDLDWYQENFAKAYLGSAFQNYAGPNEPTHRLDESHALKLKYYLQTGMAKEPAFTTQQNGVYIQAYLEAQPRLDAYLADGGEKWANTLYQVITSPPQMILMVNRIYMTGGSSAMAPANNWATLLTALQGTGEALAQKYMEQLMAAVLPATAHEQALSDKATVMQWLPEWLKQWLNSIASESSAPEGAKIAAKQLEEMVQQYGGDMSRVASELADYLVNATGKNLLEKTSYAELAFIKDHPRFEQLGKGLFLFAWAGSAYCMVKAFQNWKNLTPETKARAILTSVQMTLNLLEAMPTLINGIKDIGLNGWRKFIELRAGPQLREQMIELNEIGEAPDENWLRNGLEESDPLFDAGSGVVNAEGTLWEKLFANAPKVLAALGVVISAAMAVISTIEFIKEVQSGAPITKEVLDGITMGVNILLTVCLVMDLFVSSAVLAVAGPVLAVVGLVLAIVSIFEAKPESPLNKFMDDVVTPFVNGLPEQEPPPGADKVGVAFA